MPRKRTLNRKDFIGDFEEETEKPQDEEERDEEEEADEEEDAETDAEGEGDAEEEVADDEEAPKPKKKKPAKKAATTTKRTRTPKVVRMKAVWIVYDNSSKPLETFAFNQRAEAEAFVEQKNTDKKGACYLQLIKVPFDEK